MVEKRFEVAGPCLLQEEDAQTFFSKMSSEKQTHFRPLCLPLVFLAQTEAVRKSFSQKTNTPLVELSFYFLPFYFSNLFIMSLLYYNKIKSIYYYRI
ncbi:hypothetical protein HanPSC8_Chr05g0190061 [Helianthus annuus]|nr:hypothetical protein HanPSC8_Chr05g0190061 [Helianthus annuus]